eukprot:gnl/TRDRNA2_/TRDRNA2_132456_c1_seq1.p1 gnl/TRDRNA2_/TRDRNA2_132456_c1~~gnl/TRDRNA2_/TRDRNA2_132456_c1_seq1.p1  ORF type:complete len:376 (-),score=73.76 gnl/TRDRNA2_/TRDRNA2_132456_c1_seq1:97-1224(-)
MAASPQETNEEEEDDTASIVRPQPGVYMAFRKLDVGLIKGTCRQRATQFAESPWIELIVVLLVIADVVLVSIEAGVDHHALCIHGYRLRGITQSTVLSPYKGIAEEANLLQVRQPDWEDPIAPDFIAPASFRGRVPSSYLGVGHGRMSLISDAPPHQQGVAAQKHSDLPENSAEHPEDEHHDGGHDHEEKPHDHGHSAGGDHAEHHSDEEHEHHSDEHHGHALGPAGSLVCEDRYGHEATHLAHQLHMWSIAILCFFVIELSIKLALNPKEFCTNAWHVLDLVVVVLSLIIDVFVMWYIAENAETLRNKKDEVEMIIVLLIICRIWRVVRIVHGIFEVAHEQHEHQAELKHEMAELEEKNKELEKELEGLKKGKK